MQRVGAYVVPRVEQRPFPDFAIGFTQGMPARLLQPGFEQEAAQFIASGIAHSDVDQLEIGERPVVFAMDGAQVRKFAPDFRKPTPEAYMPLSEHALTRLGMAQLVVATLVGLPYGLPHLRDGALVQDIFPAQKHIGRPSSSFGSREPFAFHTDQAYNAVEAEVPDTVTLMCIRNHERAATMVAHVTDILDELDGKDIVQLRRPVFSFYEGRPEEDIAHRIGPVLLDGERARLGTDMRAADAAAEKALHRFRQAASFVASAVVLEPGQMLVTPNYTNVHARTGFEPEPLPADRRWLQRIDISLASAA